MSEILGIDSRTLFEIRIADDGYYAIREETPMFCLLGDSIQDVAAKAERAFESYKRLTSPK